MVYAPLVVTHSFAGFLTRLRLEENRKLMGYIGAYTTLFHGVNYTYTRERRTGLETAHALPFRFIELLRVIVMNAYYT